MLKYNKKDVIETLSKRNNIDKDVYNSLINHVFSSLREEMKSYSELRYSLKDLFTFFHRKNKLEYKIKGLEEFCSHEKFETSVYKDDYRIKLDKLKLLMVKYNEFIEAKKLVRESNKI